MALLLAPAVGMLAATAAPAAAQPEGDDVIVLPGASSAEGIAEGRGDTFHAGDLLRGDVFRGDLGRKTAELFIDAPEGRTAIGMFADLDGIQVEGNDLWAVQNELNQVVRARLSADLASGTVEETIRDEDFQIPTTLIVQDDDLAVVNATFDTGILPTADRFEVDR